MRARFEIAYEQISCVGNNTLHMVYVHECHSPFGSDEYTFAISISSNANACILLLYFIFVDVFFVVLLELTQV